MFCLQISSSIHFCHIVYAFHYANWVLDSLFSVCACQYLISIAYTDSKSQHQWVGQTYPLGHVALIHYVRSHGDGIVGFHIKVVQDGDSFVQFFKERAIHRFLRIIFHSERTVSHLFVRDGAKLVSRTMQSHNLRYLCNSVHLFIGVFATHVDILQLDPGSKDVGDSILIHQVHPAFRKEERSGVGRLVPFVVTWREIPYESPHRLMEIW